MKFIHTGDIHYGMAPDAGRSWSKERAEAVRDAVPSIIEAVRAERADLLLIAGDLFHHQPLVRELKEVNYLFASVPETKIVIIAGNHDRIRESSAVLTFPWAENVFWITEEKLSSVFLKDLNTEV